ncbi:hypothetical protein K0M31_000504 [Melipona bicolor]|uniref:Uncharacterized protein n=1 Tax=Melipona bicolor TaxID=60889 RepID=A0AA40KX39_9HYME|nr:hypothetical protein K0M31_000504 [Melipona bicolor]
MSGARESDIGGRKRRHAPLDEHSPEERGVCLHEVRDRSSRVARSAVCPPQSRRLSPMVDSCVCWIASSVTCHGLRTRLPPLHAVTETERIGADRSGDSLGCGMLGPRDHDQLIAGGSFDIVRCVYKDMPRWWSDKGSVD